MASRRDFLTSVLATGAALALRGMRPALGDALPSPVHWTALATEVEPTAKLQATRLIELAGNWTGDGSVARAQERMERAGYDGALASAFAAFLGAGAAHVVRVRNAQYGGILTNSASVLAVVDAWRQEQGGAVVVGGETLDIRLQRTPARWRVVEVLPAHPLAAAVTLPAIAQRVLGNARIRLPYSATADVRSGHIHASVLHFLQELSHAHIVDVSILQSGHPRLVFGTTRPSDHPLGRAVDIWALDGSRLITDHGLAERAMRFAVRNGAYNVGGPVLPAGPQYFSDRTHHDHVHVGFRT